MGFKKDEKKVEKKRWDFEYEVTKVWVMSDTSAGFDLSINGITIHGCSLNERKKKEDGTTFYAMQLPQKSFTGKDGNKVYSDIVWIPFTREDKEAITNQVLSLIG